MHEGLIEHPTSVSKRLVHAHYLEQASQNARLKILSLL
jgi:hypothetical protein